MKNFNVTKYGIVQYGVEPNEKGKLVLASEIVEKLELILDDEVCVLENIELLKNILTRSPKE